MCPCELGHDSSQPPHVRLLPIETRHRVQGVDTLRADPSEWTTLNLDVDDPEQMAGVLEALTDVRHVTTDEARRLGFWHDHSPEDNPVPKANGLIEVPRWRHALINLPHPLLSQGLVILDTPGLNATGAEPELTIHQIPQAHVVVFLLAADTGVTRSDMAIWREHLAVDAHRHDTRMVVLNKIDTLWDPLRSAADIEAQIQRQRAESAATLGLPESRVLALSAQKGLLAKVQGDARLLHDSRLGTFEQLLGHTALSHRQRTLSTLLDDTVNGLSREASRVLQVRRRDLAEQLIEFKGLRGKNAHVIAHMRQRVEADQAEFETGLPRVQAVRAIHRKLRLSIAQALDEQQLENALAPLALAFEGPGLKLGLKKAYAESMVQVRACLASSEQLLAEMGAMLTASFRQLNADHGFELELPPTPDLQYFHAELDRMERHHLHHLGVTQLLRLAQPGFSARLLHTLTSSLRGVFQGAQREAALWSKGATAQLGTQIAERRRGFTQRSEGIDRIHGAAENLEQRLRELSDQEQALRHTDLELEQWVAEFRAVVPVHLGLLQAA